jgi:hypothetical protein
VGKILKPAKVKLIAGFIFKDTAAFLRAKRALEAAFGKADFESPAFAFGHTDYYYPELGKPLKRKFLSFAKLIPAQKLAVIKNTTNAIEEKLRVKDRRRSVNIDPGYLDLAKLVLATTKDYSHRVYLSAGIFAEVTLFYQQGSFQPWPWTYPDYRSKEYIAVFNQIREIYHAGVIQRSL